MTYNLLLLLQTKSSDEQGRVLLSNVVPEFTQVVRVDQGDADVYGPCPRKNSLLATLLSVARTQSYCNGKVT